MSCPFYSYYPLYIDLGGHVIFNISDYWFKYMDFGIRLDAKLQDYLESGILETVVKERSAYIYPVEDATIYVLMKARMKAHCEEEKLVYNSWAENAKVLSEIFRHFTCYSFALLIFRHFAHKNYPKLQIAILKLWNRAYVK